MPLETGTNLGQYKIVAPLGAGGMGEVYRATDTRLGRDVAIKVLPGEVTRDRERLARFEREARLLAALNHPHIAAIYGLEEADGQPFLVLELVEGEDLRQRLRRGPIPVAEALAIAGQIAQALEAAHGKGIVHRDLKPANVTLTRDGQVKVLDFGLARAYRGDEMGPPSEVLSQSPTEAHQATEEGVILGTAAYMSPEQARGQPIDKRTDIWAFGVVLFEMLTGRRPFTGGTLTDTLAAVLEHEVDWETLPGATTEGVRRVLRRCLERDRERRLHDIADARIELEEAGGQIPAAPQPSAPPTARHPSPLSALPWALGVLALIAVGWWALRNDAPAVAPGKISSLVVLPLDNLMNDPEQDYLVKGMHEALITELSRIGALSVVSRTSAMAFEGNKDELDPKLTPEIAEELGVDAVVEGSVLRVGNTVRVTIQLIEGRTDSHLWADSFDRDLSDILALHSDVARAVAREIQVSLTPAEELLLASAGPVDPDAYDLYLRGRDARFSTGEKREDLERAEQYFRLAIEKQPDFALGWAGLAETLTLIRIHRHRPEETLVPEIREAADRALALDETAPEVHVAAALVKGWIDHDLAAAEKEILRALELDPRHWNARREYAQILRRLGRLDEALVEYERVQERDPLSSLANFQLGRIHFLRREFDDALEQFEKLSPPPLFPTTASLVAKGATLEEVRDVLDPWKEDPGFALSLAYAHASTGDKTGALRLLEQADWPESGGSGGGLCVDAALRTALGQSDEALSLLQEADAQGALWICDIGASWLYDPLRADPRFASLLGRRSTP